MSKDIQIRSVDYDLSLCVYKGLFCFFYTRGSIVSFKYLNEDKEEVYGVFFFRSQERHLMIST